MIAGVPGAGINGVFYLFLAVWMPVRRLWHSATRRQTSVQWTKILFLLSIAIVMTLTLWAEFVGIERLDVFLIRHFGTYGFGSRAADAIAKLAPRVTYFPFILLVVVWAAMHLLRFVLWASSKLNRSGVASLLIGFLVLAILSGCRTHAEGLAVYQPAGFNFKSAPASIRMEHDGLDEFYQLYFNGMAASAKTDPYGLAIANQVLGILRSDPSYIVRACDLYAKERRETSDAKIKDRAGLGMRYCDSLLSGKYRIAGEDPRPVRKIEYAKDPAPRGDFHKIILGRSVIHVPRGALIKTQTDRVTRDWLEAFHPASAPWDARPNALFPSHEGSRVAELAKYTGARVVPVWGMKATKVGDDWYAPDATGAPRFEISEDKITDYPSTIVVDDHTAISNDTHGISGIAWDALDANVVVGCGDHPGKMDAAYYLAQNGVNVYFPTDRYSGRLIGARTKGAIVGSAPITKTAAGADIGNQPVAIGVNETIVVSKGCERYPLWYYDTPWQYFTALRDYTGKPLKLVVVEVAEYGKAMNVVEAARKAKANVLGIRVKSRDEHDAVAAWLRENPAHRAVLFHTAAYADGYRLFAEFPRQTTFGDIRPAFE
ncbi:hypothetical protein LLG95_12370 [bacterium]|nr:hypothetical protein [bacterium]